MFQRWAPSLLAAAAIALAWWLWPGVGAHPQDDPATLLRQLPPAAGAASAAALPASQPAKQSASR